MIGSSLAAASPHEVACLYATTNKEWPDRPTRPLAGLLDRSRANQSWTNPTGP